MADVSKTAVHLVEVPDVDAIEKAGAAHPVFGRLLDVGTYARLTGFEGGRPAESVAELFEGELSELADVDRLTWAAGPVPAGARPAIDQAGEAGPVFVVLSGAAHQLPLVVAVGHDLPSMGHALDADADTLRRSVRYAAGTGELDGSLFAEPPFDADTEEVRLRERLRQLYGEE
jgi:hypothetical protein